MYRKVPDGLTEREVEGELVILHGATGEVHQLNQVAACIWRNLKQDTSAEMLVGKVAEQFEVDRKTAQDDVDRFLANLAALKLIEVV